MRRLRTRLPAFVGAEVLLDAVAEVALRLTAAVGVHVLPEQRVEIVATAVVGDVAHRGGTRTEVTGVAVLGERLLGRFEAVYVSLMVGVVVPGEHLFGDVWLQRVVVVRERWQFGIGMFGHMKTLHQCVSRGCLLNV